MNSDLLGPWCKLQYSFRTPLQILDMGDALILLNSIKMVSFIKQTSSKELIANDFSVGVKGGGLNGKLFWRVIFVQIRCFKVMNVDSLQSQLLPNT